MEEERTTTEQFQQEHSRKEIYKKFSTNSLVVPMESSKSTESKWKSVQQKHAGKVVDFQVRVREYFNYLKSKGTHN